MSTSRRPANRERSRRHSAFLAVLNPADVSHPKARVVRNDDTWTLTVEGAWTFDLRGMPGHNCGRRETRTEATAMAQVEVLFTDAEVAALEKMARAQRVSVAELIRKEMGNLILSAPRRTDADQRAKARAMCGRYRSGCRDLAQRHDDYLAEIYGS